MKLNNIRRKLSLWFKVTKVIFAGNYEEFIEREARLIPMMRNIRESMRITGRVLAENMPKIYRGKYERM